MGAVKEQKPKRCLSSQESFSAFSFLLHWLSLPLQALLRKGASSGCSATQPARLPALLQQPAAPSEDSSGAQPCPALRSSRSSQPTLLVGLSNQPKLLLLLLRNLRRGVSSGCRLCFNHQLHLWRILLENHIDLCPDLPRSCRQSGINRSTLLCDKRTTEEF